VIDYRLGRLALLHLAEPNINRIAAAVVFASNP
jgi:hypothetical protein